MIKTSDIIVLIPGIGGSRLTKNGKTVYDLTLHDLPRLIWSWAGGDLAFGGGSAKPDDGVVATDLFNNQWIPGYFGVEDYTSLSDVLKAVVQNPPRQFVKFPYDWRASNRWAAEALNVLIRPKLHDWRNGDGGADAKLWLVCHSMGGLVARYFLEHLGGTEITRHLITIGTPHRGAPKALNALVKGIGIGPLDFSAVLRSFASTYELLPQYPMIRVGDNNHAPLARVADFFGFGSILPVPASLVPPTPSLACLPCLPHINSEMLSASLDFHAAIRRPVIRRMEAGEKAPYTISCFFNRRQPTSQSATWLGELLSFSDEVPTPLQNDSHRACQQGDGTVPGRSAVPIEWSDTSSAISVDQKHAAMPSSDVVTNVIYNLANPLDAHAYMGGVAPEDTIGLAVPPLVLANQAFEVVVDAIKAAWLTITVAPVGNARPVLQANVRVRKSSSASVEFTLHEPGSYLVTAKSVDPLRPSISDWLVAISPP